MALSLKVSVVESKDATFFDFKDVTGLYNAVNNPGGYGTPNPLTNTATNVIISILPADSTTPTIFTLTVVAGTITGVIKSYGLVNTVITPFAPLVFDQNFSYRVQATDFPNVTSFTDQNYVMTYVVNGTSLTVAYSATVVAGGDSFFVAKVRCCINGLMALLAAKSDCGCGDTEDVMKGDFYVKAAIAAANCGKLNAASNALLLAQGICGDDDCGCGGGC